MQQQLEPTFFASFWAALFPNLTAPVLTDITILDDGTHHPHLSFHLTGAHNAHKEAKYELRAVPVGEADTSNSTVLHIPHLNAVVTGDVVYGHCYQYLAENPTPALRAQWLASIDKVAALGVEIVIPSHALAGEGYGWGHLAETKVYTRGFEELLETSGSWEELEEGLVEGFPGREGGFILRYSAQSFFGAAF